MPQRKISSEKVPTLRYPKDWPHQEFEADAAKLRKIYEDEFGPDWPHFMSQAYASTLLRLTTTEPGLEPRLRRIHSQARMRASAR